MKRILLLWGTLGCMAVMAETVVIEVAGMTCPLCTSAIKHSLKKVEGVTQAKVRLNTQKATVTYKGNVSMDALLKAVKKAGYTGTIQKKEE